jgi:hypothetical protein
MHGNWVRIWRSDVSRDADLRNLRSTGSLSLCEESNSNMLVEWDGINCAFLILNEHIGNAVASVCPHFSLLKPLKI